MARFSKFNVLCVLALIIVVLGASRPVLAQSKKAETPSIPMVFEQNKGQVSSNYSFLSRRNGVATLFQADGVDLFVPESRSGFDRLQIRLKGANSRGKLEGVETLPGESNYLRGSDPARWVTKVPQFAGIKFGQVYEGIDLVFHGTNDDLENDFLVAAGAEVSNIGFELNWPARISSHGDLEILVGTSTVTLHKPVAYQQLADGREAVPVDFVLADKRHVSFEVGSYDHARALVIDPVFIFSTYLAGTSKDQINAVTVDATGNIYVTGNTMSVDFPVENPEQSACDMCGGPTDGTDAFVSKLDPTGHSLLYSTYLGGSGNDSGSSIAIDVNSNIVVAGISTSYQDFPHAGSVKALTCQINANCFFVSSIKSNGSAFNYSGLVGGMAGNSTDNTTGVLALDGSGDAYLAGTTDDPHFQLTAGTLGPTFTGYPKDGTFALKLDPTGKLIYSTIIPGNSTDTTDTTSYVNNFPVHGIAVDTHGNVTLAGLAGLGLPTTSGVLLASLPTPTQTNPFPMAGYVAQINSTASAINFATYITGVDDVLGMTVDSVGDYFLTGATNQTNLPVSANAYQKTIPPGPNCTCGASFVLKLDSTGKTALEATYLTSPSGIYGTAMSGIALDTAGNVVLGGTTGAPDFPLVNPFTAQYEPTQTINDLVLAEFNPSLSSLLFGSFLSSTSEAPAGSMFSGLALDSQNHLIVAGGTFASDFPTTANSFEKNLPSGDAQISGPHGFIGKIDLTTAAPSVCLVTASIGFGTVLENAPTTQNAVVKNCGNAPLQISSIVSSSPLVTASQTCGSISAGASCTVKVTYTPVDTSFTSGTITLNDNSAVGAQAIPFTGTGGLPQVYFPDSITVNDLIVGSSATTLLQFFNSGTVAWVVNSVQVTGDFAIANSCTMPLPPNVSGPASYCTMNLTFAPTKAGARTGTLVIADNQPGSPHTIPLSGNGLTAYTVPAITFLNSVPTDAQPAQLQISGSNFFPGSQVIVNGSPRATHGGYGTTIEADLTAADLAQPGELSVTVSNPAPGGGVSNTFLATVYGVVRNINVNHAVWVPSSGLLYATVSTGSPTHANQVVAINPSTQAVVSAWSVGNGPNQLAVSGDGTLLYVGLDGDGKVAQISLPAGTVNFSVGLGVDPSFGKPQVADAIRVLPGAPHSWVLTLCATAFVPCGEGVAVFDDSVERPSAFNGGQTQPDGLLFIGSNAAVLYGTTFNQAPSTFYEFAINSSGITQTQAVQNFGGTSPGGGPLDTDGTSIYVNNGQVINPATLAIASTIPTAVSEDGIKVDAPSSRVYFAGFGNLAPAPNGPSFSYGNFAVAAYGLSSQTLSGFVQMDENPGMPEVFRYGTNGIALDSITGLFFLQTSITGTPLTAARLAVNGWSPTEVSAGSASVPLTITGTQFAAGDTLTANGVALSVVVVNSNEITSTIPSTLLTNAGTLQLQLSNPAKQTASFTITVTGFSAISVSPASIAFGNETVGVKSAAKPITIKNNSAAAIAITVTMTGANTVSFTQTNNCPAQLAAGSSCTSNAVFDPTGTGARSASVTVTDSAGTQSVPLTGTGIAPPITVSPTSIAFGNQNVGVKSAPKAIVVKNTTTVPITIGVTMTGANTVSFTQTNNCPMPLTAGASCTVEATFDPTGSGARSASVTVTYGSSTVTVPLTGTGVLAPVAVSPTSLAFGSQTVGVKSAASPVTLKNNTTAAINVAVSMTGANTVSFTQTNNCPTQLAAAASCVAEVTFDPTGTGARSASVTFTTSAGTENVPATGTGVVAPITLNPTSLAFGDQTVKVKSAAKSITVTNTTTSSIAITSVAMTGANTVSFTQTNNCPPQLLAGASCTVQVTFDPTGSGARSAIVTVIDSAGTQNAPVTGTGTP